MASIAWVEAHAVTLDHCLIQQRLETAGDRDTGRDKSRAYVDAVAAERDAAEKEQLLLEELAQTPASSLAGVVAKLAVVVREADDNTDLSDFPVTHVRSALNDLQRLMADASADRTPAVPAVLADGLLEPSAATLAAWYAFQAWSQADEKRYRIWLTAFTSLTDL